MQLKSPKLCNLVELISLGQRNSVEYNMSLVKKAFHGLKRLFCVKKRDMGNDLTRMKRN